MEGSDKQEKRKIKATEIKTFSVPLDLEEIKENITIYTNSPSKPSKEEIINKAFKFHSQGNIPEAAKYYQYFIKQGFSDYRVFSNYGVILKDLGKLEDAEISYRKAIELNPNFANTHSNLGNILRDLGKLEDAEISYRKAIELNPNFANAYSNLGNILKDFGQLKEAELSMRKAIQLNPNFEKAYSNLGLILRQLQKLKEAELATRKAIELNPNYANAYTNLGSILSDLGNLKEAEFSYRKAIEINPSFTDAAFNLYGLANSIEEAEERLKQCLIMDPNHLEAKLILASHGLYRGDQSLFNNLIESKYKDHSYIRSAIWVSKSTKKPELFFNRWALFESMINKSKKGRPFYEFGVCRGASFKYLINTFKKGYGFDTFEGLPEDWHNEKKGAYSAEGIIPKIDGGKFIKGKFEDTLPTFFAKPRRIASILNFDADLYSSTICALNYSIPVIDQHTILIFDEFIMNKNWEQDEYKALKEFCSKNNLSYEILAVSFCTKQVAVKILGL